MTTQEIFGKLKNLRERIEIESEGLLPEEQACMLSDVCRELGLTEDEAAQVVGPAYQVHITDPIGYLTVTDDQAA